MVIRHSELLTHFLEFSPRFIFCPPPKRRIIGQNNFENREEGRKIDFKERSSHAHLIHNLQRNVYMTRNDRDNDKNTPEKTLYL